MTERPTTVTLSDGSTWCHCTAPDGAEAHANLWFCDDGNRRRWASLPSVKNSSLTASDLRSIADILDPPQDKRLRANTIPGTELREGNVI